MGRILFEFLDPRRTKEDLDKFKAGILHPYFRCPAVEQLILDMTNEDIGTRPEAADIVTRLDSIILALRNLPN